MKKFRGCSNIVILLAMRPKQKVFSHFFEEFGHHGPWTDYTKRNFSTNGFFGHIFAVNSEQIFGKEVDNAL